MSSVCSNAWVNFAATSSADGNGGLFHSTHRLLSQSCSVETIWTGLEAGTYLCLDENCWERRVENGPPNKRCWVLQERLLAPRTIHCVYEQLWWNCAHGTFSEAFPMGVPVQTAQPTGYLMAYVCWAKTILIFPNEYWAAIVKDYTRSNLTYDSDKLVAIAGLAKATLQVMGVSDDSYLAGLWRTDLTVDLLWRVAASGTRPATYVAPSWSWASVKGEMYFHSTEIRDTARKIICISVSEAQTVPLSDPLGSISSGRLTIRGPLIKIKLSEPDLDDVVLGKLRIGSLNLKSDSGFTEVLDHEPFCHEWPAGGKSLYFACFVTTSDLQQGEFKSEGLILELTRGSPGEYR